VLLFSCHFKLWSNISDEQLLSTTTASIIHLRNRTPHTLTSPKDIHHSVNLSNAKFITYIYTSFRFLYFDVERSLLIRTAKSVTNICSLVTCTLLLFFTSSFVMSSHNIAYSLCKIVDDVTGSGITVIAEQWPYKSHYWVLDCYKTTGNNWHESERFYCVRLSRKGINGPLG